MTTSDSVLTRDVFMTVEVSDPNRQRSVILEGLKRSATAAEIRARALAALNLPPEIDWNLRDERTGRLLLDEQRLDECDEQGLQRLEFSMQPDASLG